MVCWLVLLPKVAEFLKELEGNAGERKRWAIEVLREIEGEEGHDKEKMRKRVDEEGAAGILRIAEKLKKRKKKKNEGECQEEDRGRKEVAEEAETSL
ncbi:hypothetical protein HY992_02530 [Candidatus Micrarchaeota archaeon]|nr:hypothetical protein [Candidatus Micrarchaeota archaeon]